MQNDAGFTIIEVVIAISILAVGLLGVAAMQTSAIQVNSAAGQMTTRMNWAQDKMEELMALPYTDTLLVDNNSAVGVMTNHTDTSPPTGYTITWSVDNHNPVPNTKRIVVTVTGKGKTSRLTCMKADW
jgi:type IV pilus assembly protein PilV